MRVILLSIGVAVVLAVAAAFFLEQQQVTATDAFATTGVRLAIGEVLGFGLR